MNRFFSAIAVLLLLASSSSAQGSKGVVSASATGPSGPVAAGTNFKMTVTLNVKGGYHINAQRPSEDYLIGTAVKLAPPAGIAVANIAYPGARMQEFGFSENPLAVYDGSVQIVATLKVADTVAPGSFDIPGKVTFQACNDQSCLQPSTVDVSAKVEIVAGEPKVEKASLTITGAAPSARVLVDGKAVGRTDAQGKFTSKDIEAGRRRVRIEGKDTPAWEQNLVLDAKKPLMVEVAAEIPVPPSDTSVKELPATNAAATPKTEAAPTPIADSSSESTSERSSAPYVLAGVGVVAGLALVAYFLLKR